LKSTTSSNMKSLKPSTPKLTTEGDADSYTLSIGQGMKVLMKKPLGYQQPNLITHKNLLQISILITLENLDLYNIKLTSKQSHKKAKKQKKQNKKNKDNYVAIPFPSLKYFFLEPCQTSIHFPPQFLLLLQPSYFSLPSISKIPPTSPSPQ